MAFNVFGQDYFGKTEIVKIQSKELGQERELLIYTPAYYKENKYSSYDVIYVFDAQHKQFFDLAQSSLPFLRKNEIPNPHIVVGITSTWIDDPDNPYGRNDDLLPEPKNVEKNDFFGHANRDNFLKYIQNEIFPYIKKNYRVTTKRIFIGHSLSASFVISAFTINPNIAEAYIAISPNLVYDKYRVLNDLEEKDFGKLNSRKYLYTSFVLEDNNWISSHYARDRLKAIHKTMPLNKIKLKIDSISNKNHWETFLPGLINGLTNSFNFLDSLDSNKLKRIKISVKVPNKKDEVYISGNQKSLGNYQEGKIKMNIESDFVRTIELELTSPADVRFIGGSNKTEAVLKNFDLYNLYHITLRPLNKNEYKFEIIDWQK